MRCDPTLPNYGDRQVLIGRMRTGHRVVLYLERYYYIKILAISIAYCYTEFLAISIAFLLPKISVT